MNYSTMPTGLPTPSAIIQRMPVVVRDQIETTKLPVSYERILEAAIECKKELAECVSLDAAKTASYRSEFYAQAAKILKDARLAQEARDIKNLAYRRMGTISTQMEEERVARERERLEAERPARIAELERELETAVRGQNQRRYDSVRSHLRAMRTGKCSPARDNKLLRPQPQKRLEEAGLTTAQAIKALRVSRLPESTFKKQVSAGVSLTRVANSARGLGVQSVRNSPGYTWLLSDLSGPRLNQCLQRLKQRSAGDVAAGLTVSEAQEIRPRVRELIEWLDAFEQALPKG